jgi:hypothetical protein
MSVGPVRMALFRFGCFVSAYVSASFRFFAPPLPRFALPGARCLGEAI